MLRKIPVAVVATVALLVAAGCGNGDKPKLVTVTGKVVYKGQPLTAGSLWFNPSGGSFQGDRPSCQLQTDGSFVMRTFPYGDGVPPGTYKVTLSSELASRIKLPNYANPAKTPLTIEVPESGVTDHTFEIK